jgi:acyl-CoA oxidase
MTSDPGSNDPTRSLRLAISELCRKLLPNSIGLSDAFGLTDWELDRYGHEEVGSTGPL